MTADTLLPASADEVANFVSGAFESGEPLDVVGLGSKVGWGRPSEAGRTLSTAALSGISLYEPEELVLAAGAGTPMAVIYEALEAHHQFLPFEPADLGPFYGGEPGVGTLGGVIACNLSGPRRIQAGAARDYLLGFDAVNGRGEIFKSGGRVMKNVTGFDLSKLITGSFGTLGIMTTITIKVLPRPEKTRTVLVYGLDDGKAVEAMTVALQSPLEVNGAAHLPAEIAGSSAVGYVAEGGRAVTAIRLQGPAPSVEARTQDMRALLGKFGDVEELHAHNSLALWTEIRDIQSLIRVPDSLIWRISVPPAAGPEIIGAVTGQIGGRYYFDWAGGLIWLSLRTDGDPKADIVRQTVAHAGGHATLMRAPDGVRRTVEVFEPQDPAIAKLQANLKTSFDPNHILNPGRMYPILRDVS